VAGAEIARKPSQTIQPVISSANLPAGSRSAGDAEFAQNSPSQNRPVGDAVSGTSRGRSPDAATEIRGVTWRRSA
jgi:hypothetical protein